MHVAADLHRLLQFLVSAAEEMTAAMAVAILNLIRSTSSALLSAAFNYGSTGGENEEMMETAGVGPGGAVEVHDLRARCSLTLGRQLGGCEMVSSESCQNSHCNSEHEIMYAHTKSLYGLRSGKVSLLSTVGSLETPEQSNKILFPYEKFVRFFNWEKPGYPPCGLKNCGNSCFANVVLQCLTYTRPLAAYLLEEGHKIECQMDTWCFLCAFQTHMERVIWSYTPFVPINILSRLHYIGGNLEHGEEEDAHEFMRFAIEKMQSVFLNELGGEMAAHPRLQETSLVQHIFGGYLQSQVICSKCNNVSIQFEHMMDLTVEINGDAESLEDCLDQFTAMEWLHGDNMYRCDSCSAYVMARKCLGIQQAPNVLTIALKRFQSGRFNQLNKRVTFPETLDLRSYVNESEDGNDVYKLYAVIVYVVGLNASFCGHYICYVKDFGGNWYRVDDDKVSSVGLDEVLSQGAYMLLYSRICARPSCLLPAASLKEQGNKKAKTQTVDPLTVMPPAECSEVEANCRVESPLLRDADDAGEDVEMASCDACPPTVSIETHNSDCVHHSPEEGVFPLKLDYYKPSAGYEVEVALQYCGRDTNDGLSTRHYQDSGATTNIRYDTPSFPSCEIQEENTASCTRTHANAECEGTEFVRPGDSPYTDAKLNPISARGSIRRGLEYRASEACSSEFVAAKIPIGLSSEVKLKPLSALGGKRRRELFKQPNGLTAAVGGAMPRTPQNRLFLPENGRSFKYE